jgi:succinyl-CoA synthetase beta subunit
MDIEAVAAEDPSAIRTLSFPLATELSNKLAEKIVDDLELTGKTRQQGIEQLKNLYRMFLGVDAT